MKTRHITRVFDSRECHGSRNGFPGRLSREERPPHSSSSRREKKKKENEEKKKEKRKRKRKRERQVLKEERSTFHCG